MNPNVNLNNIQVLSHIAFTFRKTNQNQHMGLRLSDKPIKLLAFFSFVCILSMPKSFKVNKNRSVSIHILKLINMPDYWPSLFLKSIWPSIGCSPQYKHKNKEFKPKLSNLYLTSLSIKEHIFLQSTSGYPKQTRKHHFMHLGSQSGT